MTDEQKAEQIAALIREREHYVRFYMTDRIAQVDAQLSRLGHSAQAPAKRAQTRTVQTRRSPR